MQDIISRLSPETIGAMLSTLRYLDEEARDGFPLDDVNIDHVRAALAKVDADLARSRRAGAPAAPLSIAAE
jgi:hypothetical protein